MAVLNITVYLIEQQVPGSHIVFGQLRLESQIHTLLRPQMYMSVFPHIQWVHSSSKLLWFINLTWARFMYGQNTIRILKFKSQGYENLFKLLLNVLSFYFFVKNTLPLLWTRQQIKRPYSKWCTYSRFQCTGLSKHETTNTLFTLYVQHLIYDAYKHIRNSINLWW